MNGFDSFQLWFIIIGLALGSFGLRFAFLAFMGGRSLPLWLMRHLRYTAVAIIPALVAPMVIWPAPTGGEISLPHLAAAVLTFATGALTRNVLWALLVGSMSFLLLFLFAS